jgi:hypothetical protein
MKIPQNPLDFPGFSHNLSTNPMKTPVAVSALLALRPVE